MTEATNDEKKLQIGQQTAEGVYAGLTADGKQQIFAMPEDLAITMTFNDAAKRVNELNGGNALGHNDWQIGSLDVMRVLQKNQNEGFLKGTFNTSGAGSPGWYWSSTRDRDYPDGVVGVRFSGDHEGWSTEASLLFSCRPVRLVPVPKIS